MRLGQKGEGRENKRRRGRTPKKNNVKLPALPSEGMSIKPEGALENRAEIFHMLMGDMGRKDLHQSFLVAFDPLLCGNGRSGIGGVGRCSRSEILATF